MDHDLRRNAKRGPEAPADPGATTGAGEDATRQYYESSDVDAFYDVVWGGEDIHTGIYAHAQEPIADASRRTVERLADRLKGCLGPERSVLDLGSGYGGTARYLAERFGCRVVALNLSAHQNDRHRRTNTERGLDGFIEVVTGSFHDVPYADAHFDAVCSLEALCRSGDRARVLSEAARVLKPEGALAFTDLMAAEDTPPDVLHPVVSRLGVDALATPSGYVRRLTGLGLDHVEFDDYSDQLVTHYVRLADETSKREAELRGIISPDYLDLLLRNLPLWVTAARNRQLRWGILHASRTSSHEATGSSASGRRP
ncbi:SAM-dependent methyltransferase [Streptomyces halobius]|uniref:Methyltransferase domain-containing protein n=1 Tax=Streptomyces halobius TaxID=2879846 RepID=A0ABY4M3I3_9ACTN|nr:class I SAM-dependent methyltransferase [Streptomyces halobius]UQA90806.1 methyltransferase domain-containing protein [Streptomyces halobius]